MKHIGIVGFGYVGKVMAKFFKDHYNVYVYDPAYWGESLDTFMAEHKSEYDGVAFVSEESKKAQLDACDLVVVCVPTPMSQSGAADISVVEDTLSWLNSPLILVKSTVPPGTIKRWVDDTGKGIAFSPEYVGESSYTTYWWKGHPDPTTMKTHDFQIFGGEKRVTSQIIDIFKAVMGPEAKYLQTDSTTAELAKYMENCFFATKVTFCNEFFEIAQRLGVDYNELRELWLNDGRINRMHTVVFPDKRGFGGKCYPKDMNAMVKASESLGYTPKLLRQVLDSNNDFRKEQENKH